MAWSTLVSGSTAGNIKMDVEYNLASVTRTSNTNVRVVYGIRFKQSTNTYTSNSVAAFCPSGGTRYYAFKTNSGHTNHTNANTYYYANTSGSTTTSETSPFVIDLAVSQTQTSSSFNVGYGWNGYTPAEKGTSTIYVSFPTGATVPTGVWCGVSSYNETTAYLTGGYASDGGASITGSGYQYKIDNGNWINCGSTLTGLNPGWRYWFRYYVTNSQGTTYSDGSTNITTYNNPYITNVGTAALTIGNSQTISLYNPLSRNVTVKMYKTNTSGTQLYSGTTTGTSITFTPNATTLYQSIPSSQSNACVYTATFNGNTHTTSGSYSYKIKGTEVPNFSASNWSYSANLTSLTNNNQTIINGYSTVTFTINTAATSSYNATISKYNYKWGKSETTNTVSAGTGNVLTIEAVDSRNLLTSTSKTLTSGENYVPYTAPTLNYTNTYTERANGIGAETKLNVKGNLSVAKFGSSGVNNALYSVKYKVYTYSTSSWSDWYTIPTSSFTMSGTTFTLTDYLIHANGSSGGFTVGSRYAIQLEIKDAGGLLGTLTSNNILVTDGKIAVDCYQDNNGDYHRGINGMADSNYNQTINGSEQVTKNIAIPKNSTAGYGLTNSSGNSIIRDWNNQNVTVDATGNELYLGYQNTNAINILNGKARFSSTGNLTLNGYVNKDIAIGYYTSNKQINAEYVYPTLDGSKVVGSKLTLSGGKIKVGAGVSKVKISACAFLENVVSPRVNYVWIFVYKNNNSTSVASTIVSGTPQYYLTASITDIVVDVAQNDTLYLGYNLYPTSSTPVTIRNGIANTRLYVEAIA